MEKKKILYVTQEINPFLIRSEISNLVRTLSQGVHESDKEIRIFMPRFGVINERRHQLHEVIRLSGMNLIVNDYDILYELTTFSQSKTSYEAEEGHNDDLVITLVIFSWLTQQRYFKELTDMDLREKLYGDKMKELEQDLVPFGFIEDGTEEETFQEGDGTTWRVVPGEYISGIM